MEDQHVVAGADRRVLIDAAERMMARARNVLARMLVGLADVDQHGAGADEFGGAFGRNGFQAALIVSRSLSLFRSALRYGQ